MRKDKSNEDSKTEIYKFKGTGLTTPERHWAENRFNEYKSCYHISSLSDLQLLEELCFREALQERYKGLMAKFAESKEVKDKNLAPTHIVKALDENLEQILILKEKLGLFEEKKKGEDPYKYIQQLKKKFNVWKEENQGSRSLICPHCSQMIMLKIRTEAWKAQKHPFFKDKILGNKYLINLYQKGKISKEDVSNILGTSPDFVDWLIDKWNLDKN